VVSAAVRSRGRRELAGRVDLRRIYLLQAVRAAAYGFGSVILGASLARGGLGSAQVGLVLGSLLAGSALASIGLARRADRLGRRRVYAILYGLMAVGGAVFALTNALPALILAGLTGTLSVDVIESGPFTSVEQAMIPEVAGPRAARAFGRYNAIAALAGAGGALLAGGPAALRDFLPSLPADQRWLLAYTAVGVSGVLLIRGLSPAVEAVVVPTAGRLRVPTPILRLAGLFAVDSFAGGFVVQSFMVFWFTERYGASTALMGAVFAAAGLIQAGSFIASSRLAARFGLLNTMVFTHFPSNVLLALIPFAPSLGPALVLLLLRFALSQMDVPARQAYLAAIAGPAHRSDAAAVTNAVRTTARPFGAPLAAAAVGTTVPGLPFFIAGSLKALYDVAVFVWFRRVPLPDLEASRDEAEPVE
jgi:Na+/melibiose symporter-like transporter